MTGYGTGAAQKDGVRAEVEIRSSNGRFSEVRLRVPTELASHEAELRRKVSERVRRGKSDVTISVETEERPPARVRVNRVLAAAYLEAADQLRREFCLMGTVSLPELMAVPGLVEFEWADKPAAGEAFLEAVRQALDAALQAHDEDRRREGAQLAGDLSSHLDEMERLRRQIEARASAAPISARDRLIDRIRRLSPGFPLDPGRLEQEVALVADRSDISEELVRLRAHLEATQQLVTAGEEPSGKRLEFLLQEIGREINTISSKSFDLEITRCAIAIKAEAEKMREQAQNVE